VGQQSREEIGPETLPPGLYEAILTERLLGRLRDDKRLFLLETLGAAEAPHALAQHLAAVVELVLESPSLHGRVAEQIAVCNDLIGRLAAREPVVEVDVVDEIASELTEIVRPATPGLTALQTTPRPTIPLSENALLIAAKQEPGLAAELRREIESADRIDLLCAFVRWSGIRVLLGEIERARRRGVPVRVITTIYTGSTEPRALDELVRLGADVKVSYETGSTRLHAKAWLFTRHSGFSTAYIGSSNLSHTALHDGLEWNTRVSQVASPSLIERFKAAFETYWADDAFEAYNPDAFIRALQRERDTTTTLLPFEIQPYWFQRDILYKLEVERERHGRWRNLVVAATGTGKTVISAFDYRRVAQEMRGASLLFVAHRQEILKQSLDTFRNVMRDGSFGELMVGGERPVDGRHVFASIQSLHSLMKGRPDSLSPTAYDVLIVDEFHHAEAPTYRRLLDRLEPKLLLGLTATPERSDGLDLKHWFDGRIAVELRLWDALDQGLLCPFQYFGVSDGVDLASLTWSRGGYQTEQLEHVYTGNTARVLKILKALGDVVEDPKKMKALGFCVSVKHAEYMAERFREAEIPALAVSATTECADRERALRSLRDGDTNILFAVDLFNEGLDIPEIDTVLFLRPTESPVVFLQQLGRGLRRAEGKDGLTVLDFIGQQHRRFRFEERFKTLIGGDRKSIEHQIKEGFPYLPSGCSITLDRQSEKDILQNIRESVGAVRTQLVERLKELGDVSLNSFLAATNYSLGDIYSGGNPGWTVIRREAGFAGGATADEPLLSRALSRMLHIDDPLRLDRYQAWLAEAAPPDPTRVSEIDRRLLSMLHFDLWTGADSQKTDLVRSLERLWASPNVVEELRQVLDVLRDSASRLEPSAGLEEEVPLRLHAAYTRNELLAAFGEATAERPSSWREGVKWIERYKTDVFAVTLNKSEKRFSPSTRYRDYPISPNLFHWESQSTTTISSRTGQRYIHRGDVGSRVLLFVREDNVGEGLGATPFLFLGPMTYVRHEGELPIAIDWRLTHDMPPDFFQAARAAV